jgi:chromate transport protein ChrA
MVFDAGVSIARGSLVDIKTVLIAAISMICLFKYKVSPIWILIGAGIVGVVT